MKPLPSPAIVSESAVKRLPRVALWLLCLAYILPGFLGRQPWKSNDMNAWGYMNALATNSTSWLHPQLLGQPSEYGALLPYWLGAWMMKWFSPWLMDSALAARLPFILLLALTFWATWWAAYRLALNPQAQPVSFAFGGEAPPENYARAIADAALLALLASLGLAQLSHEAAPGLAQLAFTAISLYAVAAIPGRRMVGPMLILLLGLCGLVLCGAPSLAMGFAGGALLWSGLQDKRRTLQWVLLSALVAAALATVLRLWHWRIALLPMTWHEVYSMARLLIWFSWPTWPLAMWTLWRWRHQLLARRSAVHIGWPLWFVGITLVAALITPAPQHTLLQSLPAMAILAAFALPTLQRSVAALIDWFTLLFFSGCAVIIWVVWLSMHVGVPARPAMSVRRLLPGFEVSFSWLSFLLALAATLAWVGLVYWRTGRHRAALWKSLVLPAAGATLSWLLLLTLWLPILDFARSYASMVSKVSNMMHAPACVHTYGLSRSQIAAFQYYTTLKLEPPASSNYCPYLIVDAREQDGMSKAINVNQWKLKANVYRSSDSSESVGLFERLERVKP